MKKIVFILFALLMPLGQAVVAEDSLLDDCGRRGCLQVVLEKILCKNPGEGERIPLFVRSVESGVDGCECLCKKALLCSLSACICVFGVAFPVLYIWWLAEGAPGYVKA